MAFEDLTGKKYGKLTVISFSHIDKNGKPVWHCKCDCDVELTRQSQILKRSGHKSCGCDRFINLIGVRYGRLLALSRIVDREFNKTGTKWKCRCDCGEITIVASDALRRGLTKSCGCLSIENTVSRNVTHGMSKTKIYHIWASMIARCKSDGTGHPDYGGRGITVCTEWVNSFDLFYAYVGDRPAGKTLDRINYDGNYEPGNVRWADHTTQQINQRLKSNNKTGIKGVTLVKDGKFLATLVIYGAKVLSKEFFTLEEAMEARRIAEEKYHKPLLDAK